jgi:hypothetical protein
VSARFRRLPGGVVTARFDAAEAAVLRQVFDEVLELLGSSARDAGEAGEAGEGEPGEAERSREEAEDPLAAAVGIGTSTRTPEDPVLARLFPDGYRDDPDAAADFRRYTEVELREGKRANARLALAGVPAGAGRVRLHRDEAQAWLRALNDARLALGTRLEVSEDPGEMSRLLSQDDPRAAAYAVYSWLGWLQETLVSAL